MEKKNAEEEEEEEKTLKMNKISIFQLQFTNL